MIKNQENIISSWILIYSIIYKQILIYFSVKLSNTKGIRLSCGTYIVTTIVTIFITTTVINILTFNITYYVTILVTNNVIIIVTNIVSNIVTIIITK